MSQFIQVPDSSSEDSEHKVDNPFEQVETESQQEDNNQNSGEFVISVKLTWQVLIVHNINCSFV